MRVRFWAWAGLLAMMVGAQQAQAADYPRAVHAHHGDRHHRYAGLRGYVGECVRTRVVVIGAPAGATPVIQYADGVQQAFDDGLLGHEETRPGDPIQLCLVSFTRACGLLGDERPGRTYATGNLRTGAAWTLPDIRSSCAPR